MTAQPLDILEVCCPGSDFDEFYRRVQPKLLAYARTVFRGVDAEEVTSETMARALENFGDLHPARSAWPWLVVVARRVACDAYRDQEVCVPATDDAFEEVPAEPIGGLDDYVVRVERARFFEQVLSRLSPADARLLRMRLVDGMTHGEIAELLGSTPMGARQQFHRARQRFVHCFDGLGGELHALVPLPLLIALDRLRRRAPQVAQVAPAAVPLGGALAVLVAAPFVVGLLAPSPDAAADPMQGGFVTAQRQVGPGDTPGHVRGGAVHLAAPVTRRAAEPATSPVVAVSNVATVEASMAPPKPFGPGTVQQHRVAVNTPVGTLYLQGQTNNSGSDGLVCHVPGVSCG